jgi:hypothetical protein
MFHINIEDLKHIDRLFKLLFSLLSLNITSFHSFSTISFFYICFLPYARPIPLKVLTAKICGGLPLTC